MKFVTVKNYLSKIVKNYLTFTYELEGYEEFTFITERSGDFWVFSQFPTWW